MEETCRYAIAFLASYVAGSVPFGFLIGKFHGIDIRRTGSGNIGATNVLRTLGKKWGYLCFFLDFSKGFLPVLLAALASREFPQKARDLMMISAAAGAFSGHIWTMFLKFRGGKGVATAAGAIFAMAPHPLMICAFIWTAVFVLFRYVSLASIAASIMLPIVAYGVKFIGQEHSPAVIVFFTAISLFSIVKHRSNILRLMNGTENRFDGKKRE